MSGNEDNKGLLKFYQSQQPTTQQPTPAPAAQPTPAQKQADAFASLVISHYTRRYGHAAPAEIWDELRRQIITPVETTQPHGGLTPSQAAERTTAMQSIADRIIQADEQFAQAKRLRTVRKSSARLGAHTAPEDASPPAFESRAQALAAELMSLPYGNNIGSSANTAFNQWKSTHTHGTGRPR